MCKGLKAVGLGGILLDIAGIVRGSDHDDLVCFLISTVGILLQGEDIIFVLIRLRHIVLYEFDISKNLSTVDQDCSLSDNPRTFEERGNCEWLFFGSSSRSGDSEKSQDADEKILHFKNNTKVEEVMAIRHLG